MRSARCVTCGLHLCGSCRTKLGVQNFCFSCNHRLKSQAPPPPPPSPNPAKVVARARVMERPKTTSRQKARPAPTPRSPLLASVLSVVPGLGQMYAGRFLRGVCFFGSALLLHEAAVPLLLGSFLFVFNLWDAYRVAQLRNRPVDGEHAQGSDKAAKELRRDKVDDGLMTLTGLGVLGVTFWQMGGLMHPSPESILPLALIAAALVFAQETRK